MAAAASALSRAVPYDFFRKACLTIGEAANVILNDTHVPAYKIQLDFGLNLSGEHKTLYKKTVYTSSAQLCSNHTIDEIFKKQLLCVINFPRRQIGKMMSDCLVTGVQKHALTPDEKRESTIFMRPSEPVELGSRIGILGETEALLTNPRNLALYEFFQIDFRIGTIEGAHLEKTVDDIQQIVMRVNLGDLGTRMCVGRVKLDVNFESFNAKQCLVLTNLDLQSKKDLFDISDETCAVLCTVNGKAVLEPAKPVEDGYKLA